MPIEIIDVNIKDSRHISTGPNGYRQYTEVNAKRMALLRKVHFDLAGFTPEQREEYDHLESWMDAFDAPF